VTIASASNSYASNSIFELIRLPERIRTALIDDLWSVVDHRATEIEYPIESHWLMQVFWEMS
jgi:hypothetical protein